MRASPSTEYSGAGDGCGHSDQSQPRDYMPGAVRFSVAHEIGNTDLHAARSRSFRKLYVIRDLLIRARTDHEPRFSALHRCAMSWSKLRRTSLSSVSVQRLPAPGRLSPIRRACVRTAEYERPTRSAMRVIGTPLSYAILRSAICSIVHASRNRSCRCNRCDIPATEGTERPMISEINSNVLPLARRLLSLAFSSSVHGGL